MKMIAEFFSDVSHILIAFAIVAFMMLMFFVIKPMMVSSKATATTISTTLTNQSFSSYDNTQVQGSDVISAIGSKATSTLTVVVETADGQTISYTSSSYNLTNPNVSGYIEPTANFQSTLSKTANGTVNKITFVQQ